MKSKWNLVIHKAYQHQVSIWVGTLFPDLRKPDLCLVRILLSGNVIAEQHIHRDDWLRPFDKINDRFYQLLTFTHLLANTYYQVEFIRTEQATGYKNIAERILAAGSFYTLPNALQEDTPFVIATGSCFYNEDDNGAAADALNKLYFHNDHSIKPQVKFFTGDQVYLDIGLDSLSPVPSEVRRRIADDYALTWQTQRSMLRNGANWFLADDHEYWNNYPYTSGKNPYLWAITAFRGIKKAWQKTAQCGVENVQQIPLFDSFNIGNDLSVCVADLRSGRDKGRYPKNMMPEKDFAKLIHWAENLTCPGVIVLPQPLLVKPGGALDYNLANYKEQYQRLLIALARSGHDIVCLSGDVHYGRIAKVPLGTNGAILHEIISSPMSNLTGLDGKVAASKAEKMKQFPLQASNELPQFNVHYEEKWSVSTQKIRFLGFFSYSKTREHVMTLSFSKLVSGEVSLSVNAWQLRGMKKNAKLPKKEFKVAHTVTLS